MKQRKLGEAESVVGPLDYWSHLHITLALKKERDGEKEMRE